MPIIYKEKGNSYVEVDSREKLGIAAGINRATTAVAVIEAGEAKLK